MKLMRYGAMIILFCSILLWTATPLVADTVIQGKVTDDAGKPVRGALVKVSIEKMTMQRFSQKDGGFEISVPPGKYTVTVDAYGYGLARKLADTSQGGTLEFKLSPGADVARMSGAELESLLPNTKEGETVKQCNQCHGFTYPMRHAGWEAKDWADFLPHMNDRRLGVCVSCGSAATMPDLSHALETIFGPDGMWGPDMAPPDLSKVQRTEMTDAALKATIKEWTVPTPSMVHSVTTDPKTGMIWFGEYDALSNKLARFNPETEKFDEFPLPIAKARPHTGGIDADGDFVIALASGGKYKLASVDREGKITLYEMADKQAEAHTSKADPSGKMMWVTGGGEVWGWDVASKKFTTTFKNPVPETFPEGSQAAREARPGQKPSGGGYDAVGDSKGNVWLSELENGLLVKIDTKTGAMKTYHTPEMRSVRGLAVDAQDNVWWGDYYGHKLGHLDAKTDKITLYQPPTRLAAPYGVVVDMKRGYIWYADTVGNQISRFDPQTEQFMEIPLPQHINSVRFPTIDAEGHAWYGGYMSGKLGEIDADGLIKPMTVQR